MVNDSIVGILEILETCGERSGYATEEQILATSGIVIMYQVFTMEVINKDRRQLIAVVDKFVNKHEDLLFIQQRSLNLCYDCHLILSQQDAVVMDQKQICGKNLNIPRQIGLLKF